MRLLAILALVPAMLGANATPVAAGGPSIRETIDAYVEPYVRTNNFSGAVYVDRDGERQFLGMYGYADRAKRIFNTEQTRFHIASLSMQYTAAAFLRLVDSGKLSLDGSIASVAPNVTNARSITFRELLEERSGVADINGLPDYSQLVQAHQTPSSLVERIAGLPATRPPGSPYTSEEHSAYNILALAIEQATGLPFDEAVREVLLTPAVLPATGEDVDRQPRHASQAVGYQPVGTSGVEPAAAIAWSAKSGNGSSYTTIGNEAHFVAALLGGALLSDSSRHVMFDPSNVVGYGWFDRDSSRFSELAYSMNGRAPGFSSFVLYLPKEQLTVIVLSNIYSSATTQMGNDIAAIALGKPYVAFAPMQPPPSPAQLARSTGTFRFAADFFRPGAAITLRVAGDGLELDWGSGTVSPLIPVSNDRFIDRSYWETVSIERDRSGIPIALQYGTYRGVLSR
jgi:CubicO group peptidase (beta-lactamase class C family)